MLDSELSTDMDRLTQLQDSIESLLTITAASINYLTTKTSFKPLNPTVPVTFKYSDAEQSEAAFEENKKQLVSDLLVKAKAVEFLINNLPDKDNQEEQAQRYKEIQAEMEVANEEYRDAVKMAEGLLAEISQAFSIILQDGQQKPT